MRIREIEYGNGVGKNLHEYRLHGGLLMYVGVCHGNEDANPRAGAGTNSAAMPPLVAKVPGAWGATHRRHRRLRTTARGGRRVAPASMTASTHQGKDRRSLEVGVWPLTATSVAKVDTGLRDRYHRDRDGAVEISVPSTNSESGMAVGLVPVVRRLSAT